MPPPVRFKNPSPRQPNGLPEVPEIHAFLEIELPEGIRYHEDGNGRPELTQESRSLLSWSTTSEYQEQSLKPNYEDHGIERVHVVKNVPSSDVDCRENANYQAYSSVDELLDRC